MMRYLFLSVLFLFLSVQIVSAQVASSTFNIRVLIGSDIIPPTTPTLLVVDPVATTQINLSWSSSTDNFAVSGYSILRDGAGIATTTLLSYSDTSLTASTTYSYVVYAFDAALNYSSSSNSLSTTTLDTPSPPSDPVEESQQGTAVRVVVKEFTINEGISTSSLNLKTVRPARIEIRWGRTASYELGYVVSDVYSKEHETLLTDLEPGTTYEYEVIGYTPHGNGTILRAGLFTTLVETLAVNPVNVSQFTAIQNGDDIDLSWQIPKDDTISHVRIVRSNLGFPEYPQAGAIVYQGAGESVKDVNILSQYSPVYYTAFVYDTAGNISSGAVAIVYGVNLLKDDTENNIIDGGAPDSTRPVIETPTVIDEATSSINFDRVTVEMKMPQPSEITIDQKENSYSLLDTDIVLDTRESFFVSIPSSAVAGNLKSIIATILDPTDNRQAYSYLLRINKDQTAYEATIAALQVAGRSQIRVEIYDYEAFVVATYQTPLTFTTLLEMKDTQVIFPDALFKRSYATLLSALGLPLVFSLTIFLVYRRRGEDNT